MLRCGDRREWLPVAALVLFAVTLFSALNLSSPLGRELGLMVGGDPGAYLYVGKAWLQGDLPYAGALDNKGPLFHLFNLIGYAVHPTYGIWVVGSAVLAVSVVIAYRLARHFLPSGASLGVTALMLASYAGVYQGGNYTEDYALPFILGVLLIAARRWTGGRGAGGCAADQGVPGQGGAAAGRIPRDLMIAGVLGGCVLLIRHNMLAPWILLVGALLVEWRILGGGGGTGGMVAPRLSGVRRRSLGALLLGGLAAVTPFVLYLVWTGTFAQFIDAYVLFNLRYVDTGADSDRLLFLPWAAASLATLLPAFAAMVLAEVKPPAARGVRLFNLYAISSLGAQILLLAALGTTYWQYLIALVPYVLVGAIAAVTVASRALAAAGPAVSRFTTPGWIAVMLLALTVVWAVPSTVTQHQRLLNRSEPRWDLVAAVGDRVQQGERILVLGLHAFVYLETDTLASSRLFYQYPLVAVDSDLRSELLREIEQSPPRVVVDAGYRPESGVWGQVLGQVGTALRAAGYERIDSAADPRLQPDMTIWVHR